VLSSSPTKRDTKQYLQTIGSRIGRDSSTPKPRQPTDVFRLMQSDPLYNGTRAVSETPRFIQGPTRNKSPSNDGTPHIAVVQLCEPQKVNELTLDGVAKTIAQLNALGMSSVIIPDLRRGKPDTGEWMDEVMHQSVRIARAVDAYSDNHARIVESVLAVGTRAMHANTGSGGHDVYIDREDGINSIVSGGAVTIVPPYATSSATLQTEVVSAADVIMAITRYLSGIQFMSEKDWLESHLDGALRPARRASVHRVIILDAVGGVPASHQGDVSHIFLNMEEEYALAQADIDAMTSVPQHLTTCGRDKMSLHEIQQRHRSNLQLAKEALAILPPASSVIITTPSEAANARSGEHHEQGQAGPDGLARVGTRLSQNPLIHNLLTDRPVYSSSLPTSRAMKVKEGLDQQSLRHSRTTHAKRGLPVTIFPDVSHHSWKPPIPGAPRLRLTDSAIDLPRLVHLINDSFSRELDVQHYLDRVNRNLAGVIIVGEYEGGAILTWELPNGLDEQTAFDTGRLVPYLDKFAVLKRCQGVGGHADIVFKAMVRDCFPAGVCWRSRGDNPVNKWYFERSVGTRKIVGTNWTMFWTTPDAGLNRSLVRDYETVCRNVVPSWKDSKRPPD
jgi:amino-acid N-acetyltransferase